MKMHPRSPSIRRRRLSAELKRARKEAGLSTTATVQALQWAAGKLSNIEQGTTQTIKPADLDKLLDLYQVQDVDTREAMHQLARDSKIRGWWTKYKDVFKNETLPDFEAEASAIRTYEAQVIPGLLQIPEYTKALFNGGRYTSESEIDRRVEARMARRDILNRFEPAGLRAVIDEAAFHRLIGGGEVMRKQISYLLHMAQMPHIDVQVLPYSTGAHAGLTAPFIILDFPNPLDPTIVCVPTLTDALYLELPEEIHRYTVTFGDLQGSALSAVESAEYITELLASLDG